MADIFNLTDTWNSGGTTYYAIKMNVTNTASATPSYLMDLQVGGTSKFSIDKDGSFLLGGTAGIDYNVSNTSMFTFTLGGGYKLAISSGGPIAGAYQIGSYAGGSPQAILDSPTNGLTRITNGSGGAGTVKLATMTVASLISAATVGAGAIAFVSDATATTARSTVAGGGANFVMVMSNGTNWLIVA